MERLLAIFLVVGAITNGIYCAPTAAQSVDVIKYLESFWYLPEAKNSEKITQSQLKHALKRLQVNYFWI